MKDPSSVGAAAAAARELSSMLEAAEGRLLALIRQGAQDGGALDDVLAGIEQLASDGRPPFRQLDETLARRDLSFEIVDQLQVLRRHWLWLYRKIHHERIFFSKIKLERGLRDTLYRQVVETTHELSSLDDQERVLQTMDEEALARHFLGEPDPADHDAPWAL